MEDLSYLTWSLFYHGVVITNTRIWEVRICLNQDRDRMRLCPMMSTIFIWHLIWRQCQLLMWWLLEHKIVVFLEQKLFYSKCKHPDILHWSEWFKYLCSFLFLVDREKAKLFYPSTALYVLSKFPLQPKQPYQTQERTKI